MISRMSIHVKFKSKSRFDPAIPGKDLYKRPPERALIKKDGTYIADGLNKFRIEIGPRNRRARSVEVKKIHQENSRRAPGKEYHIELLTATDLTFTHLQGHKAGDPTHLLDYRRPQDGPSFVGQKPAGFSYVTSKGLVSQDGLVPDSELDRVEQDDCKG